MVWQRISSKKASSHISMSRMIAFANKHRLPVSTAIAKLNSGTRPKGQRSRKKSKNKAGEFMNSAINLQSQPLHVFAGNEASKSPLTFNDNLSYIEFLVAETRLWLAAAYLRLKQIDQFKGQNTLTFLQIPSGIKNVDELNEYISNLAALRLKAESEAAINSISLKVPELVAEYGLDEFSRKVFQLIFIADTSMEFKAAFEECDIELWSGSFGRDIEVGVILSILCKDYREQMQCRATFAINQPLLKYEIIELSGRHLSFLQNDVTLHERISRFCLDDNNVYDIDLLCINSEWPNVKLSQVVLGEGLKEDLLRYTESFLYNNEQGQGLSDAFGYGAGLTCLFYGLSGTGKTMLAHGLANHLGCQLFSVNIGGLQHADISFEEAMQHIFREARLTGGIVFLDECDDLLTDNTHMSRTFLIEIEKAECITILATNKTVRMDPALDRRISLKIPFTLPGEKERLAVWQALLPSGMRYGDDVDLHALASKYHFTGGLIKNSLLMAAGNAMVKAGKSPGKIILSGSEIHKAARHQAKSMFDLGAVGKLSTPAMTLADLNIRRVDLERLEAIARLVPEIHQSKEGFCGLISVGNSKVGIDCVDAVATESGLMVRQFAMSNLFNEKISADDRPLDPFTQQRISLLEYVFAERPGQQEIIILVDDSHLLKDFLGEHREKAKALPDWQRLKKLMRDFRGILFVVTDPLKKLQVPIEFACHLSLNYPAEDCQIRAWQDYFPHLNDLELVELIEQFPMYIQEIELVARQTKIMTRLEGFEQVEFSDIISMSRRLRGAKTMPFLFGDRKS